MVISKSEYMLFLRHPAWLWLKKNDKDKLPLPDAALQALFDEGTLFEGYAEKLFPDAVKLGYKNEKGEFSGTKYWALPDDTKKLIEKGTKVILQGRVEVDFNGGGRSITAIFDVFERAGDGIFNLYEIKSSTAVKSDHTHDLAFQTIVLEKAGYKIEKISVVHVNNKYERHGEIESDKIVAVTEITDEVREAIPETLENIEKAFKVLDEKSMPDISPRYLSGTPVSEWLPIYEAVKGKILDYSIYKLATLKPELVELLEEQGVEVIGDIPLELGLTAKQEAQVIATKTGERAVNKDEIQEFLKTIEFPIHFFDFESLASVIPPFDGTRPYQQIPFQYSLHIWPDKDSELVHREYLHTENSNPVPHLLEKMKEHFEGRGSVISWSKKYEVARNNEMAKMYPEYEKFLHNVNDRMIDLMDPFAKGWFVDKEFFGSASIKKVLPVLVPTLSYKKLEINNGEQALRIWVDTVLKGKNQDKKDQIMENLRKYCALDTYSMYAILKYLTEEI